MEQFQKILYVDDEPINLKLLHLTFKAEFEIIQSLSAEEGMTILLQNPDIQIIISDLRMPGMDGLSFIKEIKSRYPSKICMLLTGYPESGVILEGFKREFIFRYLTKPWKKADIKLAIEEAFQMLSH